jgi:hypothetical protein
MAKVLKFNDHSNSLQMAEDLIEMIVNPKLNESSIDDSHIQKILKGLSQAFYYYDPTAYRVTQLETVNQLTNEGCTRYFKSFDKDGTVETTLVVPNRNS